MTHRCEDRPKKRGSKLNRSAKTLLSLTALTLLGAGSAAAMYYERPFRARMGSYVTDLSDRSYAQRLNIERAGRSLDGVIVKGGEIFSLNDRAGPYTAEHGFSPERSFVEGKTIETEGGGVCQVSSTLYNAARLAGMRMVERVLHSKAVRSVPPGMDAALAYGVADLKWENPYPFPVQIRSRLAQDQLKVEIWGKESIDERFDH